MSVSDAATAISSLDKEAWAKTTAAERLEFLHQIQRNLSEHQEALGAGESALKNARMKEELFDSDFGKMMTIMSLANNVTGAIDLYTALVHGQEFKPAPSKIVKVDSAITGGNEDLYDITVAPRTAKEMLFYATRSDRLRVKGEPVQKGPYDKEPKLVAVLGAGNYASPLEIIKALFFDSSVVAYKSHPLNADLDEIWVKVFQPLIDAKALAFCASDQGPAMTTDSRVDVIYFTGGAATAEAISKGTKTPLVSECGGVNPNLIVPGDRPWTQKELAHHAQQIVTIGKLNGGAICARPQLIVTCKNWSQRDAFLVELEKAVGETTFACGSYYPGCQERMEAFANAYPNAKRIRPENGAHKNADVLLVTGDSEDSYSAKNEAFCQVFTEVPLDTKSSAKEFLEYAVDYSNNKVLGTLCATIVLDETTRKNNEVNLQKAITDLKFGNIGVNLQPVFIFASPYLAWGGHDDDKEGSPVVSGRGNFGNLFGFQNVQKSIYEDAFVSPAQFKFTNKKAISGTFANLVRYSIWPSWWNLSKSLAVVVVGSLKAKDW